MNNTHAANVREELVPSPVLGTLIFIGTEFMFFAALISAHLAIRMGEADWPPLDQPRLPVIATALNSLLLLASAFAAHRAGRAFESPSKEEREKTFKLIATAFLLGLAFILFQGFEWVRLIGFGLTAVSSLFGGLFYIIIGTHALHAAGALCFMGATGYRAAKMSTGGMDPAFFKAARVFWYFVVAVWPILYVVVYL